MSLLKKFLFLYVIAAFIIVTLYSTIGFYFETGSDVYVSLIQKGIFTSYGEGVLNNYGIYILLTHLFAKLQYLTPQLDWLNIFILFSTIIITGNLLYFSFYILKIPGIFLKTIIAFSIILLGLESAFYIETARTSSLLTGSSIIILLHLFKENKLNFTNYLFFFGISILGLLVRIESGMLIIALTLPIYFFISNKKLSFLKLIFPYFIAITFLSIFLNTPINDGDKSYSTLRPYQFNLWDYGSNSIDLNNLNELDALIYNTASNFFFADDKYINKSFFDEIGVEKADKTPIGIFKLFKNAKIEKLFDFYEKNQSKLVPLLFIYGLFMVYLLIFSIKPYSVLLITAYSTLVVFSVAYLMKMEMRIFHPILIITLMLIIFSVKPNKSKALNFNKIHSMYLASIFITTVLLISINVNNYLKQKVNLSKQIESVKNEVKSIDKKSIIIVNLMTYINWEQKLSIKADQDDYSNLVVLDNFLLFLQESQKNHLKTISGFDNFNGFMKYLTRTNKNIYMISSQQRKKIINKYLDGVYHLELTFKNIFKSKEKFGLPFIYTIDEINIEQKNR
jgi:hypothetical protein